MIVEIFILITTRAECRAGRHKPRTLPGGGVGGKPLLFLVQHNAGSTAPGSVEEGT